MDAISSLYEKSLTEAAAAAKNSNLLETLEELRINHDETVSNFEVHIALKGCQRILRRVWAKQADKPMPETKSVVLFRRLVAHNRQLQTALLERAASRQRDSSPVRKSSRAAEPYICAPKSPRAAEPYICVPKLARPRPAAYEIELDTNMQPISHATHFSNQPRGKVEGNWIGVIVANHMTVTRPSGATEALSPHGRPPRGAVNNGDQAPWIVGNKRELGHVVLGAGSQKRVVNADNHHVAADTLCNVSDQFH